MPSYLLKVTKFPGETSQFEFLWQRKIFLLIYKPFLSLNISYFNLFFMWQLQHHWKKSPTSFPATPSKGWGPAKPPSPFWKFGWRRNLPAERGEGAHYVSYIISNLFAMNIMLINIFALFSFPDHADKFTGVLVI